MSKIQDAVEKVKRNIPPNVILLAAAKTRSLEEVEAVIQAGIVHIGYNYIQEALPIIKNIGSKAQWHMIGHLQTNKAKIAVQNFDMIETIDSIHIAQVVENHCKKMNKILPVLIEINSGEESNKTGVLPGNVENLILEVSSFNHLKIEGLMTMGPRFGNPEKARPYFQITRKIFERINKLDPHNVTMKYLSMGMSNTYQIAIEEGANLIRLGTKLFGTRE